MVAGCRLHFGLLSASRTAAGGFGGIGVMTRCCATWVRVVAGPGAATDTASAPVAGIVDRFEQATGLEVRGRCSIQVRRRASPHQGLGSGTQLALATATALDRFFGSQLTRDQLVAQIAGRGARSGIGFHGFFHGGFLYDTGLAGGAGTQQLAARVAMPEAWRVVMIQPAEPPGPVFGEAEESFFERMSGSDPRSASLQQSIEQEILPAVRRGDFDTFASELGRYNESSGMLFADFQGGPYNGENVARLVERVRGLGWPGVGQSSWGPTVFVTTRSQTDAAQLCRSLCGATDLGPLRAWTARFLNEPAHVHIR